MSVLIETSLGDLVIDLEDNLMAKNFIKLCKIKYFNYCHFYNIVTNFTCQTGDPLHPQGDGGASIWGVLDGKDQKRRLFEVDLEELEDNTHKEKGTVSMSLTRSQDGTRWLAGSQFVITLVDGLERQLDSCSAVFGHVVEGIDVLDEINGCVLDDDGRPITDILILHTHVLDDPYEDPADLQEPPTSPEPSDMQKAQTRLPSTRNDTSAAAPLSEAPDSADEKERRARAQALTLELLGDLPSADFTPDEKTLFVRNLNPVTQSKDLQLIFSRFGDIVSCNIIKDKTTGDSLQYGFIEFATREACERAYTKMDRVLVDDRRIRVDFSQSAKRSRGNNIPQRADRAHRTGKSYAKGYSTPHGKPYGRPHNK